MPISKYTLHCLENDDKEELSLYNSDNFDENDIKFLKNTISKKVNLKKLNLHIEGKKNDCDVAKSLAKIVDDHTNVIDFIITVRELDRSLWNKDTNYNGVDKDNFYLFRCLEENHSYITNLRFYCSPLHGTIHPNDMRNLVKALETNTFLKKLGLNKIDFEGMNALVMMLKTNSSLQSLEILNNQSGDEGVVILSKALETNTALKNLFLREIGNDGIKAIASMLTTNTSIQSLTMYDTQFEVDGVVILFESLLKNSTLADLTFEPRKVVCDDQAGNKAANALAKLLLANTLQYLYSNYLQLGDSGTKIVAEALIENRSLKHLSFFNCRVGNSGAEALASALVKNKTLIKIDLSYNKIGENGAKAFYELIKINPTLIQINLDNNYAPFYYRNININTLQPLYDRLLKNYSSQVESKENSQISSIPIKKLESPSSASIEGKHNGSFTNRNQIQLQNDAKQQTELKNQDTQSQINKQGKPIVTVLNNESAGIKEDNGSAGFFGSIAGVGSWLLGKVWTQNNSFDQKTTAKLQKLADEASIAALAQVPQETVKALATINPKSLEAVSEVEPEIFHTLSRARRGVIDKIIEMGKNKVEFEKQYKEIQTDESLREYYDFFQRHLIGVIVACSVIKSGKVMANTSETIAESVIQEVADNIAIPVGKEAIVKVLKTLFSFGENLKRSHQVNRITIYFPNILTTGAIVEILARYLAIQQKNEIHEAAKPVKHGKLRTYFEKAKKVVKYFRADDITTPIRALAVMQGQRLIDHWMSTDPVNGASITIDDLRNIISIATNNKIAFEDPIVSNESSSNGQIIKSLESNSACERQESKYESDIQKLMQQCSDLKEENKRLTRKVDEIESGQKSSEILNKLIIENIGNKVQGKNITEQINHGFECLHARDETGRRAIAHELSIFRDGNEQFDKRLEKLEKMKQKTNDRCLVM